MLIDDVRRQGIEILKETERTFVVTIRDKATDQESHHMVIAYTAGDAISTVSYYIDDGSIVKVEPRIMHISESIVKNRKELLDNAELVTKELRGNE